ncbi:MAG: hypothetical protein EOP83_10370 [Verrucomicrobiaceae bacterium]|nr:MAG: hypothetical protein EOP83_10370 [Verrucomicrobiaceae bacterium]
MTMDVHGFETTLSVGPRALGAYSRLSYTMWYALAEFIDNSTQSRLNYGGIIDEVLAKEGTPLVVEITHDRLKRTLRIRDNSIGMSRDDLENALKVAHPTPDSKGRSKYGMGMKTAACWIGEKWSVITTEWGSSIEWTAEIDVPHVVAGSRIPVRPRQTGGDEHYTEIVISNLNRHIQGRTEENIREYIGSMYRYDLREGSLKLIYNGEEIRPPGESEFDTDEHGNPYKRDFETHINGHSVRGWVAVLRKGKGGRKFGGFSLFQNRRQIQGFPAAWKPRAIFGGVDDEGANNLIAQRLTGLIELDGFDVSHTKDAILFRDDEQEQLEAYLAELTKDYRDYASRRRGDGERGKPWSREKVKELIEGMKKEFTTDEIKDAAVDLLPPLETILANNQKQVESLTADEEAAAFDVLPDLRVIVSLQERSENDPYLTISAGAKPGTLHVIINNLHAYYSDIDSPDAKEECLRQYIYDAIAEYQVSKLFGKVNPDAIRRKKNSLLHAKALQAENAATAIQNAEYEAIVKGVLG